MSLLAQKYEDFAARVHDKGFYGQALTLGHFELTFKCPLECAFCYCTPYMSPEHTQHEVSTGEALRILDEAAGEGCLWMTFSGGDPFTRRDFRTIYDHARSLGLVVTIYCSGLLMTDEWLEHLAQHPPFSIEAPLYGVTAATHEAVAGRPRTFERTLANLRRMLAAGLKLKIKSKITQANLHEVESLRALIEGELGLEFFPSFELYPRLDATTDHLALRLGAREIQRLTALYGGEGCDSNSEVQRATADPVNPKLFRCASGENTFFVNPYGRLNFCNYLRTHSFDLRAGSLREGVEWLKRELLGREQDEASSCRTCSIQGSCQNCPARAYLATGNMNSKDQGLCELNHVMRGKAQ